jgi:hypothetical protein
MLIGVEEPNCLIHAPNESVDPTEIENMAVSEAMFLQRYPAARSSDVSRTAGWSEQDGRDRPTRVA